MIYKANVTDLAKAVNKWNDDYSLGLRYLGAMGDKAAWGVGNRIVTAEQLTPMRGEPMARIELDDYRWESPSAEVNAVWPTLHASLKTHFEELPLQAHPPGEGERIAQKTLQSMKTRVVYPDRPLMQGEAERERRAKMTEAEWAAAFFGAADTAQPAATPPASNRQGEPSAAKTTQIESYRSKLRQNLAKHFNLEELRTLCFELGINHENLAANTIDGMARELVTYCVRREIIPGLVAECRKLRPDVSWEGDYQ